MSMQGLGWHVKYRTHTHAGTHSHANTWHIYENWQEQQWNSNSVASHGWLRLRVCVCVHCYMLIWIWQEFSSYFPLKNFTCKNSICGAVAFAKRGNILINSNNNATRNNKTTIHTHTHSHSHTDTQSVTLTRWMNRLNWIAKTAMLQRMQLTNWPIDWWADKPGQVDRQTERGRETDKLGDCIWWTCLSVCHISCFPICKRSILHATHNWNATRRPLQIDIWLEQTALNEEERERETVNRQQAYRYHSKLVLHVI